MLHTSPRLRHLVRVLRPLPSALGEEVLAAAAVVDGVIRPERRRQVWTWAAAQLGAPRRPPWRLALALLANHGRFCGEEALIGAQEPEAVRRDVVVEGADHLDAAHSGAILLGFHLGSPRTWFRLRALGYPVRLAGRLEASASDPRWAAVRGAREVVPLPAGPARERLTGLYQIRELLRDGGLVYLTADGPFGREAFRVDLPGGALVVRMGWLALRRATPVPILPVLGHREGRRRVIVIHPPLPAPDSDHARDVAACRDTLAPIVETYVRRFPAQCRYLALPLVGHP